MTKKRNKGAKIVRKKRSRTEVAKWFAELDRLRGDALFPEGRNQPFLRGNIEAEKRRFFKLADQLCAISDLAQRKRIKGELAHMTFEKK